MTLQKHNNITRTPFYSIMSTFVSNQWMKLKCEQIEPWCTMNVAPEVKFRVKNYYGKSIAFQGIGFEGTPSCIFWGRYIEPFLENIVDVSVNELLRLSKDRVVNPRNALPEVGEILKQNLVCPTYMRMKEIDLTLRKIDAQRRERTMFPKPIPHRDTNALKANMENFIDKRINGEILMARNRPLRLSIVKKILSFRVISALVVTIINFFIKCSA